MGIGMAPMAERYDMKAEGEFATLNEHSDRLVRVRNRRHIPGGVCVDVEIVDKSGWYGPTDWTTAECNVTYVKN